jgi:hypothetical protein
MSHHHIRATPTPSILSIGAAANDDRSDPDVHIKVTQEPFLIKNPRLTANSAHALSASENKTCPKADAL